MSIQPQIQDTPKMSGHGSGGLATAGVTLGLYGLALNQSNVIFGANLSLADPLALLLLAGLALSGNLWIARTPLLFFLTISVTTLLVSIFLTEPALPAALPASLIARDFLKTVAAFASFIIGASLARTGKVATALRCFTFGAAAVSGIAIIGTFAPVSSLVPELYYGGFRFRGLMNDPNYFAITSVAALAITWRDSSFSRASIAILSALLASGILLSGSKTGLIVLAIWAGWRMLKKTPIAGERQKQTGVTLMRILAISLGLVALACVLNPALSDPIARKMASNPATARLAPLLLDFDSAVAGGGSSRDVAWATAGRLIDQSPLYGVGVGSYLEASEAISGERVLAHNTFLQIGAEWGLPLAIAFSAWAIYQILPPLLFRNHSSAWHLSAEAFSVLMVGSMGLSLNNSRLFWLLLGVAAYHRWTSSRPNASSVPMKTRGTTRSAIL